jgi:hypothetical protein
MLPDDHSDLYISGQNQLTISRTFGKIVRIDSKHKSKQFLFRTIANS